MTFEECCLQCAKNDELVKQFNRLTGHSLKEKRTPIQKVIDDSCNYNSDKEASPDFSQFIFNYIWLPLVDIKKVNSLEECYYENFIC